MTPSFFNTLIVIRFYNENLQAHHCWVTDSKATAVRLVADLESHKHITDISTYDATCKE